MAGEEKEYISVSLLVNLVREDQPIIRFQKYELMGLNRGKALVNQPIDPVPDVPSCRVYPGMYQCDLHNRILLGGVTYVQ
jgi:hypothetical protein